MRAARLAALGVLLTACTATAPVSPPPESTSAGEAVDLDVLFVGAHPDDEAWTLSTLGQWTQAGYRSGVVTITRGEGGGNAVGPEEGPALGLLREDEERRAVGMAGVTDVFALDEVDFFYTVSAPLTQQVWGAQDTLERLVRVVRQTRPDVLLTMDPAPSPGNHGNHQEAARLAIEAYHAAADPAAFPGQIADEGLQPWAPGRILYSGVDDTERTGPGCVPAEPAADPTLDTFAVWSGTPAPDGRTWAAVERDAQRHYASQGWAVLPDVATDPAVLGCDVFTLVHSRTPYPAPGTPEAAAPTAALAGSDAAPFAVAAPYGVTAGVPFAVTVPAGATLTAPVGWTVTGTGGSVTVTPPADATPGTHARLTATSPAGHTSARVEVAPPVRVAQEPLPQVAEFAAWTPTVGAEALRDTVPPVLTLPSGGSREVPMTVTNLSGQQQSGTVEVALPAGFAADAASRPFTGLAPGASATVPFVITNTDPVLPTSDAGGDVPYRLSVTTDSGAVSTVEPALELVPATAVPAVEASLTVDGVAGPGEYPGPVLDLSRLWEGDDCTSPADCSATARLARSGDMLAVLVEVRDETRGAVLPAADCKRHWRTDSVEIAIDPTGTSENTASTYKLAVLPSTAESPPCAARDADQHQGPIDVPVASTATADGYTVEVAIPLTDLPAPVDPERMGLNLLVYDSDTQDHTGQSRIGWSTWEGVQGDPYRWGRATLPGWTPQPGAVREPVVPGDPLLSTASPQSIEQAVAIDVPLAGAPAAPAHASGWLTAARPVEGGVEVTLASTAGGDVAVFVRDAEGTAGSLTATVDGSGEHVLTVPIDRPVGTPARAVAAWTAGGGTLASAVGIS